ncbi:MAG: ParA family protein [Pseudomonadales bacterium]|nr:ParA family protein [Pseudomonadales bacterium]
MFRVAVVNSKGGAGKTTVATNLVSYYCSQHLKTALIDYDSQGSSTFWAATRTDQYQPVQSIAAHKQSLRVTKSWYLRPEPATERIVIDSPSGLDIIQFRQTLSECDAIIIPVLPSSIDIHAVAHFVADLLMQNKDNYERKRIAVIANRVRKNTLVFQKLERFLATLGIPFVAVLRDTQEYVKASELGLGIFELDKANSLDIRSWGPLLKWLDQLPAQDAKQTKHSH